MGPSEGFWEQGDVQQVNLFQRTKGINALLGNMEHKTAFVYFREQGNELIYFGEQGNRYPSLEGLSNGHTGQTEWGRRYFRDELYCVFCT